MEKRGRENVRDGGAERGRKKNEKGDLEGEKLESVNGRDRPGRQIPTTVYLPACSSATAR